VLTSTFVASACASFDSGEANYIKTKAGDANNNYHVMFFKDDAEVEEAGAARPAAEEEEAESKA